MCQFISFFHNPENGEIRVYDLNGHAETENKLALDNNVWCEGHYLPSGKIELRLDPAKNYDQDKINSRFLSTFPNFVSFFNWAIAQKGVYLGGGLDLSGLTTLDPKVKLPDSIGGWLYLSGLTETDKEILRKKYPGLKI